VTRRARLVATGVLIGWIPFVLAPGFASESKRAPGTAPLPPKRTIHCGDNVQAGRTRVIVRDAAASPRMGATVTFVNPRGGTVRWSRRSGTDGAITVHARTAEVGFLVVGLSGFASQAFEEAVGGPCDVTIEVVLGPEIWVPVTAR
jgi:hypothetical protein